MNIIRPDKYWASSIQDISQDNSVDIVLGLRQDHQLSGFLIDLEDGLIPSRIDIYKEHRFDNLIVKKHRYQNTSVTVSWLIYQKISKTTVPNRSSLQRDDYVEKIFFIKDSSL